jgi:hypothetical protein
MAMDGRYAGNAGAFSGMAMDSRYAGTAGAFSGGARSNRGMRVCDYVAK